MINTPKKNVFEPVSGIITRHRWCHLAFLVVLPALIYFQCLRFGYTFFDDNGIIAEKFAIVGDIHKIDTAFKVDAFFNKTGDFYRPVQNISFMLDAQVSGQDLWMFHLTNLLIHILTCISLYFFLQFLAIRRFTAFLLALLFSVHPLFASCVGWVPSRGDILIGLFGIQLFMTFGLYFRSRNLLYFILHAVLFLVTIFTKETTVLVPLFCLYYYFFIVKAGFGLRKLLSLVPFILAWATSFIVFYMMRRQVSSNTGATVDVLGIIPFLKNNTVIPTIVGKFFIPFNLSPLPLYDNASTILGIICLVGLLYITFESTRDKKWGALMGLLWFLLFAIPPTIYRLENADTFFNYLEHRTYLPMIGVVIILGYFLDHHFRSERFRKSFLYAYIPVILVFSILAWLHCGDYRSNETFTLKVANQDNPSGFAMRASQYLKQGDTTNALSDISNAIRMSPDNPNMYYTRGTILAKMLRHEEAENDFSLALSINPGLVNVYLARSVERRMLHKFEGAFRDIYFASRYDSLNPKVYFSFGNLFLATHNYAEADSSFSKAIALQPRYAEAYNNRAYTKWLQGDYSASLQDGRRALSLMNTNIQAVVFNNLGKAFTGLDQPDSALHYFNRAIAGKNDFAEGYFERGNARKKFNDAAGACEDWKKAITLGYKDTLNIYGSNCKDMHPHP